MSDVELYEEMIKHYNEICQAAMVKLITRTKGINDKVIPLKNFDRKDPEHLFMLSIAKAVSSVLSVPVSVDASEWHRRILNSKIKLKEAHLIKYQKEYDEYAADVNEVLDSIRDWAEELCGDTFLFGDIYHEFYE
jgi:hypothetical protein